jgi:hypothetical protein
MEKVEIENVSRILYCSPELRVKLACVSLLAEICSSPVVNVAIHEFDLR